MHCPRWLPTLLAFIGVAAPDFGLAQTRPPPTQLYELAGTSAGQGFGATLACLPSFASAGSTSLGVGSPSPSVGSSVQVFDGLTGSTLQFSDSSVQQDARFGGALSWSAGVQLAGTGLTEVLVGSPSLFPSITQSRVTVYGGPSGAAQFESTNSLAFSDAIGYQVRPLLGDVNANGRQDFIYSAITAFGGGAVFIDDVVQTSGPIRTIPGGQNGEEFGAALDTIQDLDGGGQRDLLVGAPGFSPGPNSFVGRVAIISTESQTQIAEVVGDASDNLFGFAVATIGDVDGDGIDDFVVGAPNISDGGASGYARVFRGVLNGTPQVLCTVSTGVLRNEFGIAVAPVGDIDGDFVSEFAIGAPGATAAGSVFLVHYDRNTGTCPIVHTLDGAISGERFGASLAAGPLPGSTCDYNGDNIADIAVGAPAANLTAGSGAGRVVVFRGNFPVPPTPTATPTPAAPSASLAFKIQRNGELDGAVTFSTSPPVPCELTLFARTTRRDLSSAGPVLKVDVVRAVTERRTRFAASRLRRALCDTSGIPYSVHFIARARCDGATVFSNVLARQASCGLEPPLSRGSWETQLMERTRMVSSAKRRKRR